MSTGEGGLSLDETDEEGFKCKRKTSDVLVSNKVSGEAFW